ncbi:Kunitz/Bovine pancreatic trypsin inhibitor domain protein [Ancylostoma duodenale]|uniref:Kunitz/Bovine pancreatic trypsin inhibitor domain protein n=1 Tax=Ancylostoma duodenale TaxID=51022 RepID=A0A0C2GFA7_9BILA|nr:Kunitz/Bovine pancreatic trypsin inhibitor domain protein [Ancylostoma duodenale]
MKYFLLVLLCVAVAYCAEAEKKLSDEERCNAPTHLEGPQCMAFFKRYTYNKEKKECEEFVYGGCHPSPNNFETLEECKKTCVKK